MPCPKTLSTSLIAHNLYQKISKVQIDAAVLNAFTDRGISKIVEKA